MFIISSSHQRFFLALSIFILAQESTGALYRPNSTATLIAAVTSANGSVSDDIIDLQGQTFTFSSSCGTCTGSNGPNALPPITSIYPPTMSGRLTIINGSIVRSLPNTNNFRLIEVERDGALTLVNVTLEYGLAEDSSSPPDSTNDGGAIYNAGCLILENTNLSNNTANDSGGGLYNAYTATVDIQSTNISNNIALAASADDSSGSYAGGGGIFNEYKYSAPNNKALGQIVSIDNSSISKNITLGYGAGINNQGSANNIFSSTILYNYCCNSASVIVCPKDSLTGGGGGIYQDGNAGSLEVFNSTIAYNQALNGGGNYNKLVAI